MRGFWRGPVNVLGALLVGAALLSLVAGTTAGLTLLVVAFALLLLRHLVSLRRLLGWLESPTDRPLPYGSGLWEDTFAGLARLLRQQRQSEAGLRGALERFQDATSAMNEAVIILDELDRIEWCNPSAEHYFEIDARRDLGRQLTYIVRQPQFLEYLLAQNFAEPFVLRGARGGESTLSVQMVPYGNRQKLVISRDITRLERLEETRRDLVANVSHELRTPITVIVGFLETLNDAEALDPAMQRRALELMTRQAARMQTLVEDLLTLSRLENARGPAAERPVDVPAMARSLLADAQALSGGQHEIAITQCEGPWLSGSEDELRSAFTNLVSNAVRYTPAGGRVSIAWRPTAEGGAAFSVRDTGIGIEAEHIPRLTERFYRVDRSRSRETGGTGLGLAIVKYALSHHQARLEVESAPGQGSTFTAVFPPRRACSPAETPAAQLAEVVAG